MEKRSENHPICMKWKFVRNHWKSPDLRAKEISQAGDVLNSGLESVLELNIGDHIVFRSKIFLSAGYLHFKVLHILMVSSGSL